MNKVLEYIKMHVRGKTMKKPNSGQIMNFLNTKWNGAVCPMCQGREWNVEDTIYELREFKDGNLIVTKDCRIIPVVPITCTNCGNTVLLNPLAIGLMEK